MKLTRLLKKLLLLLAIIALPLFTFADPGGSCNLVDPITGECLDTPLDSYVWIIFTLALIAGVYFLYKKQKQTYSKI